MDRTVAPPFSYYGGKTMIANRIVDVLPPHDHYVEPFAGSLAVLLAKPASRYETANDLNGDLVTFWRVLRDRPDELIRACAMTPHARAELTSSYAPAVDDLEQARRVWVRLSQGRTSRMTPTGWCQVVKPGVKASLPTYLAGYVGRMQAVADRLSNVSLECRPALELVEQFGAHDGVLIYADPPYLASTRNGTNYAHEMAGEEDHRALADALCRCRATVVLSGYDSPLYAALYADWHVTRIATMTAQGGAKAERVEVLWSNRPLGQATLFDGLGA